MTADPMLGASFGDKIIRAAELQGVKNGAKCSCTINKTGSSKKEPCAACSEQPEGTAANTTQIGNDTANKAEKQEISIEDIP